MSLFITSLNSGSNGNCYYVGNDKDAILVDAGISCREIEKRMKRLGLAMNKVRAVLVSHEHWDHIRGLPVLSKKFALPVYITEPAHTHGELNSIRNTLNHLLRTNRLRLVNLASLLFPNFMMQWTRIALSLHVTALK